MAERLRWVLIVLLIAGIGAYAWMQTRGGDALPLVYRVEPEMVMGTSCSLVALAPAGSDTKVQEVLQAVVGELRRLEALMSTWIEASPMSRFNSAPAGEEIDLAREILEVLHMSYRFHGQTGGTFDITSRPLIELWRQGAKQNRLPSEEEIARARNESNWDLLELSEQSASKSAGSARVDIDGIAKGYAIDQALARMKQAGLDGGMVEIGGDLSLFGTGPESGSWRVAIRSPFEDRPWGELAIAEGAVCSSGGYARSSEIEGRRYSHILDPRSGRPLVEGQSVTVIAPDAATADVWATALSVLGSKGLELLPDEGEIEALVVSGEPEAYRATATPGFSRLLIWSEFDLDAEISPTTPPDRPSS